MATITDIQSAARQRTEPHDYEKSYLNWLDRIESEGRIWRDAADRDRWEPNNRIYHGTRAQNTTAKWYANVIRPTIDRRNALLTENKPSAKILPWRDGLTATSTALGQLFEADWQATGMAMGIEEMVQLASVFGSAGIDLAWNPSARFGEGEIDPTVLDPRQVIFDPLIRKSRLIDKAMYLRIRTVKNLWDIQREYPSRGMLVTPDRSVSSIANMDINKEKMLASISTDYAARLRKLEEGPIPRKITDEYWIRDPRLLGTGKPAFALGRHSIRGGDVILEDAENPYWDGLWPVEWYDSRSDIDSPWGRSEVEALRYVADSLNRIANLFVENSILGGNLVVLHDADAITNETRNRLTNVSGLIIPKKFGRSLEYRPPPPMPPHMLQFIQFAQGFVDYLVGLSDGGLIAGKGRVEMRSGVQLEGLQNAAQVLVKASARRLESFMERLGQKWLSRVFQFKTGNRLMYYLGENNEYKEWQFNYAMLQDEFQKILKNDGKDSTKVESLKDIMQTAWRQFAFKVTPLSSLWATKVARVQMLAQFTEMGMFPRTELMREAGFDNAEDLIKQSAEEVQKYGAPEPAQKSKKKK